MRIVKATQEEVTLEDLGLPEVLIAKLRLKAQKVREKKEREGLEKLQENCRKIIPIVAFSLLQVTWDLKELS